VPGWPGGRLGADADQRQRRAGDAFGVQAGPRAAAPVTWPSRACAGRRASLAAGRGRASANTSRTASPSLPALGEMPHAQLVDIPGA
jgi:hypothetical protein